MCEHGVVKQALPNFPASIKNRRSKLWELDVHWHCPIIGTCITDPELKKLGAKCKAPDYSGREAAYKLHAFMVGQSRQSQGVGRVLHKFIERKYARTVKAFAAAKTGDDVAALWIEAVDQGDIAGAFWAVMTHELATLGLKSQVYGEVHMLSHTAGASNRVDHETMAQSQKQIDQLQADMKALQASHRKAIDKRDHMIGQLKKERDEALIKAARADELEARLIAEQEGQSRQDLNLRIQRLTERVLQESDRADSYQRYYREENVQTQRLRKERDGLAKTVQHLESDLQSVETHGVQGDAATCMKGQGCSGSPDLCGRCIAYIGGQTKQTAFFRDCVEQQNGAFIHHDGGLHDGQARLMSILAQADAVMFPVTCVSHEAVREIKRVCMQQNKPFVPLRTQGLGAFTRGLEDLTTNLGHSDYSSAAE